MLNVETLYKVVRVVSNMLQKPENIAWLKEVSTIYDDVADDCRKLHKGHRNAL